MAEFPSYCQISGCTPEIGRISETYRWNKEIELGPKVQIAVKSLLNEDEKKWQEDLRVIACVEVESETHAERGPASGEAVGELHADPDITVIPCKIDDDYWDQGSVVPIDPSDKNDYYNVAFGDCLLVQNGALDILWLATNGWVTPQILWKLAQVMGREDQTITGLDYGSEMGLIDVWEPRLAPGISDQDLVNLEALSNVDEVKNAIIHEGKFWIWMRPDRFPLLLDKSNNFSAEPTVLDPGSGNHLSSLIEHLPNEVLMAIVTGLDSLTDLLHFVTLSRRLRSTMLGTGSDRNATARDWILANAPWYIPYSSDTSSEARGDAASGAVQGGLRSVAYDILTWTYLKNCLQSGSMKNRQRIWKVSLRIQQKCKELSLLDGT